MRISKLTIFCIGAISALQLNAQIDIKDMLVSNVGSQYSSSIGGCFQALPTRKNTLPVTGGNINNAAGSFKPDTALSLGICGSLAFSPYMSNHAFYQFSADGSADWLDQGSGYHLNLRHLIGMGYQRFFFLIEWSNAKKQFSYNYKKVTSSYASYGDYNLEVANSSYKSNRFGAGVRVYFGDYSTIYNNYHYLELMRLKETFYAPTVAESAGYRLAYNHNSFGLHVEYFPKHLARGINYTTTLVPNLTQTGLMFQLGCSVRFNSSRKINLPL